MPVKKEGRYGYARYMGMDGFISAEYNVNGNEARVKWWQPLGGGTEFMFSLRADGVWRRFPGEANGPGLEPMSDAAIKRARRDHEQKVLALV